MLKPHQEDAVSKMHNGSILVGDVGVGKTYTALGYYEKHEAPRNIVVITTAKKRDDFDWQATALKFGIGTQESFPGLGTITVDSWNNIHKYTEVHNAFFIFDEQRLVGSGLWARSFIKIAKSNRWIMLSATPGDTWLDYIPVFVANGFFRNRTEFTRSHVVYKPFSKYPKVERYTQVGKLVRLRNQILVEMPYERHTNRITTDVMCEYDHELMRRVMKDRWHVYENRPLRDVSELFLVMRKVVNSDVSRVTTVENLLQKHKRLIVFYNFDYELEMLRTLSSSMGWKTQTDLTTLKHGEEQTPSQKMDDQPSCGIAEWNGHKHQPIPQTDRWLYVVQYAAGAEGWNCISTDAMAFFSQTYSYKYHHQSHGRIDRLDTPFTDLHYYYLMSDSVIDKAIKKALNGKKSFNERQFQDELAQIQAESRY